MFTVTVYDKCTSEFVVVHLKIPV